MRYLETATNEDLLIELARRLNMTLVLEEDNGQEILEDDSEIHSDPIPTIQKNAPIEPSMFRVVRTKTTADRVYLLNEEDKTRQWMTNPDVVKSKGFEMEDVVEINDEELLKYQQKQAIYEVNA